MAKKTFEENMARLEEIVALLEKGDAQLSQSLSLFEEGTKLAAACRTELDKAEQQVVRLMKGPDGAPIENEFASEELPWTSSSNMRPISRPSRSI